MKCQNGFMLHPNICRAPSHGVYPAGPNHFKIICDGSILAKEKSLTEKFAQVYRTCEPGKLSSLTAIRKQFF